MFRYNISEIIEMIYKIHGDIIKIDVSTYKGMYVRCRFVDKDYGEWWTKPSKIIYRKQGHKKRSIEKSKRIFLEKYGVDNPSKNKDIKDKKRYTCLKHYGTNYPSQNKEIINRRKQTCLKRFGFDCPAKSPKVKEKTKNTNIFKYGGTAPSKNKQVMNKINNTCLKRYGVKNVLQSLDIALKTAKNSNNSYTLKHWFSNEEIICIASYEKKVVEHFNINHIDYNWQSQTFLMPNGKTYRPDCYLPDEDKWIEIKGYFRDDAKEKWNWFHKEYPNSELWDENKLKELKIL